MKAETILKSLTFEQKVAQLITSGSPDAFLTDGKFDSEKAKEEFPNGLFSLCIPRGLKPCEVGKWVADMLECFKELSPVPPLMHVESLHGVYALGTTVFPQSIGMGSTFDTDLMLEVATVIGKEAKSVGAKVSFSPDLDLGREPRWGRIEETYGESPFLVGEMGAAYVKGLLGEDGKYVPMLKHYVAHGSPEAGLNLAPVNVSMQDLEDKYLPPFKKALDAGARAIMPAYSTLNGVPCHTHPYTMNTVLRERWGFDGIVLTDFDAVPMLNHFHHQVDNPDDAAVLALAAGVDVEAPYAWAYKDLKKLVENGRITEADIDRAVLRIIKVKLAVGAFDMQKPDIDEIARTVNCEEHKELALKAARKSMVLLKNDGALPLKKGQKIAVIGPNAFSAQYGSYSIKNDKATTPLESITALAESFGGSVVSAKGCDVYGSDTSGFAEAEALANESDAVVCIIGGRSMKDNGVGWGIPQTSVITCGEGCDMHDLTPGGPQLDLVRKMIATGKPVTVVMIDGRPETLFDAEENCSALVAAWYPGEQGSRALAELLFGEVNFSGKLPVTFPKHVGQVPICHDRVPSGSGFYRDPGTTEKPGRDYVFLSPTPAFEFGFGLGYSEIEYTDLKLEASDDGIKVSLKVENKGEYPAEESVLGFVKDEVASFPQPVKKLAAIKKVPLAPHQKASVELLIPREELEFTNFNMEKVFESGWFTVMVGNLSERIYIEK